MDGIRGGWCKRPGLEGFPRRDLLLLLLRHAMPGRINVVSVGLCSDWRLAKVMHAPAIVRRRAEWAWDVC